MKVNNQNIYQNAKRRLIIKLIFPSLFLLVSFKSDGGNGIRKWPILKREFKMDSAFQNIRIEGDISVVLTNAPAGSFIIEGKEIELNKIRPVVESNLLILDLNRKSIFEKLTLYLAAASLQTIQVNGDGNISSTDYIKSAHLHILLNGNIKVSVKTMGQLSFDTAEDIELVQKPPLSATSFQK